MDLQRYSRRAAYAAAAYQGLRYAYNNRDTAIQLGRDIRSGYRRVRRMMAKKSSAKRTRIGDPASYLQLQSVKRRYGRRTSAKRRDLQLMRTVSVPLRYHFGWVNQINATQGAYWLSQRAYDANNVRLPIYLFNLFTISQLANGVADVNRQANCAFELFHDDATGVFNWGTVPGTGIDGVTPTGVKQRIAPTASTDHIIGRKGLIDWTRVKLCIWGKKKNPTSVRVRLIRFTDEEFCPEFTLDRATGFTRAGTVIPKVNEYWNNEVKYLVNGPQGALPRSDKKKYVKVLKEFIVNINPIDSGAETVNSDDRGHMKHIDLFNRWGRILDYTEPDASDNPLMNDLRNPNKYDNPSREYSGYLRRADQAVYLLVESVQPAVDATVSNSAPRAAPADGQALTASFDISIDTNFSVIEKAI